MTTTTNERIQNFSFNQVRGTALISLTYKYGPTGRLGLNAFIRLHSTLPRNGHISKLKVKIHVYKDCEYSRPGVLTDPEEDFLGSGILTDLEKDCPGSTVTVPRSVSCL